MKSDTVPNFYDQTSCQKHRSFHYLDSNDLCLDRSVVDCRMSEILIRCKEDIYHVKDIWVDEVVPVQKKSLSGDGFSDKHSVKHKLETLNDGTDEIEQLLDNHGVVKCFSIDFSEKEDIKDDESTGKMLKSDERKFSTNSCDEMEVSRNYDSEAPIVTQEFEEVATLNARAKDNDSCKDLPSQQAHRNKAADELVKESLTLGDMFLMENKGARHDNRRCGCNEQFSQNLDANGSFGNSALDYEVVDSNSRGQEEPSMLRPDLHCDSEKPNPETDEEQSGGNRNTNLATFFSVSTSQESAKIGNFEIETSGASSCCKYADHEHFGSNNLGTEHTDPGITGTRIHHGLDASSDGTFSNRFSSSFEETSFSGTEQVSGLITYSGPIAYSGSLSMRSDSSTTSGRSFAFPVLQNEWNSSPIRMAKPDPRHLQRHKGWRERITCCKF